MTTCAAATSSSPMIQTDLASSIDQAQLREFDT